MEGDTRGSSVSNVSVDADPLRYTGGVHLVHQLNQSSELRDIDFILEFNGTSITLAKIGLRWLVTMAHALILTYRGPINSSVPAKGKTGQCLEPNSYRI